MYDEFAVQFSDFSPEGLGMHSFPFHTMRESFKLTCQFNFLSKKKKFQELL
jgi:hypothetical protein